MMTLYICSTLLTVLLPIKISPSVDVAALYSAGLKVSLSDHPF